MLQRGIILHTVQSLSFNNVLFMQCDLEEDMQLNMVIMEK